MTHTGVTAMRKSTLIALVLSALALSAVALTA